MVTIRVLLNSITQPSNGPPGAKQLSPSKTYEEHWPNLVLTTDHVLATIVRSQKFRWTKVFGISHNNKNTSPTQHKQPVNVFLH